MSKTINKQLNIRIRKKNHYHFEERHESLLDELQSN